MYVNIWGKRQKTFPSHERGRPLYADKLETNFTLKIHNMKTLYEQIWYNLDTLAILNTKWHLEAKRGSMDRS